MDRERGKKSRCDGFDLGLSSPSCLKKISRIIQAEIFMAKGVQGQQPFISKLEYENTVAKRKTIRHQGFAGGHPSHYWSGATLFVFGERTRAGLLSVL